MFAYTNLKITNMEDLKNFFDSNEMTEDILDFFGDLMK